MTARIFCKVGTLRGVDAEIGAAATLGRSRTATIQLAAGRVSGEHLRIAYQPEEGCYVLEDLGSTNGTALDGVRVQGRERLGHLHVITVADDYDLVFQDLELCARRHGASAPAAPPSEDTAIGEAFPALPERLAEPAAAADVDRTRIESTPMALPAFLAGQAEALADKGPKADETTRLHGVPAALPEILARKIGDQPREAVTDDQLAKLFLDEQDEREKDGEK